MIHTPGHTGDHICLFDPENGILLSGDHVLPDDHAPHLGHDADRPTRSPSSSTGCARWRRSRASARPPGPRPAVRRPRRAGSRRSSSTTTSACSCSMRHRRASSVWPPSRTTPRELFQERSWGPMAESETYAHLEHLRLIGDMDGRMGGTTACSGSGCRKPRKSPEPPGSVGSGRPALFPAMCPAPLSRKIRCSSFIRLTGPWTRGFLAGPDDSPSANGAPEIRLDDQHDDRPTRRHVAFGDACVRESISSRW